MWTSNSMLIDEDTSIKLEVKGKNELQIEIRKYDTENDVWITKSFGSFHCKRDLVSLAENLLDFAKQMTSCI